MSSKLIYYVYAYVRSKDSATAKAGTPYYIGKGKDERAFKQHKRSDHRGVSTPNNKSFIVILESMLSEVGAFALERRLIQWHGRIDNGSGILRNKTHGGEGGAGRVASAQERQRASNSAKGKAKSASHRKSLSLAHAGKIPWNKGKIMSDEYTRINSLAHKGVAWSDARRKAQPVIWSEERRAAQAKSMGHRKITCPHCQKTGGIGNMKRFHADNCKEMPTLQK